MRSRVTVELIIDHDEAWGSQEASELERTLAGTTIGGRTSSTVIDAIGEVLYLGEADDA